MLPLRGVSALGWPTASRGAERSEKPRVQRAKLFARVILKAPDRHGVVVRALFDRENLEVVAAAVFHLDLYALARAMAEDHRCITFVENGELPEWMKTNC